MTEESTNPTGRIAMSVAAPAILAIVGVAAYVFEQARAGAYSTHFGVRFVSADPRHAALPLVGVILVVAVLLATVLLSLRAADVSVPAVAVLVVAGAILLRPVGGPSVIESATALALLVAIALAARAAWRSGMRHLRTGAAASVVADVAQRVARLRTVLRPPPSVVLLCLALAVPRLTWHLGAVEGRLQAEGLTEFDMIRRDASTATVIFTRSGDIIERVLDVSPGADGKPRNVWLPGVVIKPMPDGGIRYETVRLGPTRRSGVGQP